MSLGPGGPVFTNDQVPAHTSHINLDAFELCLIVIVFRKLYKKPMKVNIRHLEAVITHVVSLSTDTNWISSTT